MGRARDLARLVVNSLGNFGFNKLNPTSRIDAVGSGATSPVVSLTSGETFNNGSGVVPRVPTDGLINIENGELKIWPDLDGDGDYDADLWAKSNMYLAASSRMHLRTHIPESGGAGADEGRLVVGATPETNYIQSAKNFSGTVRKDFAIGDYNSTTWWAYFSQSSGGWLGLGTNAPITRLHVSDSAVTVGVFQSTGSANARVGFRGTSQAGSTEATVGIDTSGRLVLRGTGTDLVRIGSGAVQSGTDNGVSLGSSSFRFSQVFAGTATINTSDAREKQQVRTLTDAEKAVAKKLKSLVRAFKFNDAVQSKGNNARVHFGVIAQDVKEAFESEGLDAERYAIVCYDEWEETPELRDAGGIVVQEHRPAGSRYGIRYEELLAFMISAL